MGNPKRKTNTSVTNEHDANPYGVLATEDSAIVEESGATSFL